MRVTWMLLIALCVACGPAFAEEKPKAPSNLEKLFKKLDVDKDEKLTLEEFTANAKEKPALKARLSARFARLDKDKDGKLTLDEFTTKLPDDDAK